MAATTLNEYLYQLVEYWGVEGPPEEMWSEAGELCMMMSKSTSNRWKGDGTAKVPIKDQLSGNIGTNFAKAFTQSTSSSGVKFDVPAREHWAIMRILGKTIELGSEGSLVSGESVVMDEITNTQIAFMRSKSYVLWGDGTGRISKGDGAYNVATDTVVFLNAVSASQFEIGDVVVLIDQGAAVPAGGMPTPRAGTLTVLAVDEDSGTIQLSALVNTIAGAVNTDHISKDVFFDGGGLIDGIFRYLPITKAEAQTPLYTVDRSLNTGRRAGRRVGIDSNMTPYQIIGKMGVALKKAKGGAIKTTDDYYTFVPANEIEQLTAEAKQQGITFLPGETVPDVTNLTMGIEYVYAAWPGLGKVKIVVDHFMHDPNVATDDDRTYAMLNMKNWEIQMGKTALSWKQYEDNGGLVKYESGKNQYYGQYGLTGNLICKNPSHNVVASVRSN